MTSPLRAFAPAFSALLLAGFASLTCGCISSRYDTTKKPVAAPPTGITSADPVVGVQVNALIVYHSPGSWKRDAFWDEYVVTFSNAGPGPVTIERATLTGRAGEPMLPGTDPWELEKQSRSLRDRNFGLAKNTVVQIGGGFGAIVAGTGIGAIAFAAGGPWVAMVGGFIGAVAAIPVYTGATIYRNVHGKHEIEREFARRRFALPVVIPPGESRTGSLFFPITPEPKVLRCRYQSGGELSEVAVDLSRLGGIHLAPK